MYIGEKKIYNDVWESLNEVNTGESFLIQNTSTDPVRYCVLDTVPDKTIKGNRLAPYQQLAFKKIVGELYMRKDYTGGSISIEKVES